MKKEMNVNRIFPVIVILFPQPCLAWGEAPRIDVPGVVPGSPGMEHGGVNLPYNVLLVAKDGSTSVHVHHDG